MTADRTEAAAEAGMKILNGTPTTGTTGFSRNAANAFLAAADAHDRANNIARIRLDDELAEKIAELLHSRVCVPLDSCWSGSRAVLDLLRNEALNQPQPERRTT